MKIRMLAGVACAALMAPATPAQAATTPELAYRSQFGDAASERSTHSTRARGAAPLWLRAGTTTAARELIGVLQRAPLDGMPTGRPSPRRRRRSSHAPKRATSPPAQVPTGCCRPPGCNMSKRCRPRPPE